MEKILVMLYMSTEKTELEKLYKNVVYFDFQDFKYIYDESVRDLPLEQRKEFVNLRVDNPNYPINFLNQALIELETGNIIVSLFIEHVFKAFDSQYFKSKAHNTRILIVFPERDNFSEYIERFKQRGNSKSFIERREREFDSLVNLFETADNYERIVVGKGEYLSDVLIKKE